MIETKIFLGDGDLKLKKRILLIGLMCTLVLSACGKKDVEFEDEQPKKKQQKVMEPSPLTGVETDEELGGRAVAVVINNHPQSRPQNGLSQADIVYEALTEGSVTRFLAIFQSEQPEKIGPVRSARPYFIDLAKGYDSLYIAHGYSPEALDLLRADTIDHINGIQHDGTLFKRASNRKAPHNSYITYDNILKGASDANYEMEEKPDRLNFLTEKEVDDLEGEQGEKMTISYSKNDVFQAVYQFDEQLGRYTRSSGGVATVEDETEKPILLDNVVVIEAPHSVIDSEGRRAIDLTAGGQAYVLQKGKMKEVEWRNINGRILPYEDGDQLKLVPGKTWISIVPELGMVAIE